MAWSCDVCGRAAPIHLGDRHFCKEHFEDQQGVYEQRCAWCKSELIGPVPGMQGAIGDIFGVWVCFDCGGPLELVSRDIPLFRKPIGGDK